MIRYSVFHTDGDPLARFVSLDALSVWLVGVKDVVTVYAQEAPVIRKTTPYRDLTALEQQYLDERV